MGNMLAINFKVPGQILLDLGQRGKDARLRLNMSRKTLAERSGVAESSIKRFENTGLVSSASLVGILIALDRSADLEGVLVALSIASIRELDSKARRRGRR